MKVVKRVNPKHSHHKENNMCAYLYFSSIRIFYFSKEVCAWDDGCSLNVLWSFHDVSQTIARDTPQACMSVTAQKNWKIKN